MPQLPKPGSGKPGREFPEAETRGSNRPHLWLAALLCVPLLALGACGENRSEAKREEQARSAKLVLPTSITPPVVVGAVKGAPGAWKLSKKVAAALRQRDIPAFNGLRRDSNYRLTGSLSRRAGGQLVIRWTLLDPAGTKVGEVTQMAALPAGQAPNEDILESVADAAAESLSPIVPSSKLQTARKFDTGEPTSKTPKEADDKNRVTAVGKIKTDSPLSRNLLTKRTDSSAGKTERSAGQATAATTSDKSVTAIGRMRRGSSALSRNLMRGGEGNGSTSRTGRDVSDRTAGDKDRINTQATTSRAPKPATRATRTARATRTDRTPGTKDKTARARRDGTMADLISRYPTSLERESGLDTGSRTARERAANRKSSGRAAVRRVADNDRSGVARDYRPRAAGQVADNGDRAATRRPSGRPSYRWWVQIGSYGSEAEGQKQWSLMRDRMPASVLGMRYRVKRKDLGRKGVWYRLQVGPADNKTAALRLCTQMKRAKIGCFIVPERVVGTPRPDPAPKTAARPPAKSAPPPKVNRGETTSGYKPKPATPPPAKTTRPATPPAKDGNGISVYDWKTGDKKGDRKEPPLSTRPGLPGVTN